MGNRHGYKLIKSAKVGDTDYKTINYVLNETIKESCNYAMLLAGHKLRIYGKYNIDLKEDYTESLLEVVNKYYPEVDYISEFKEEDNMIVFYIGMTKHIKERNCDNYDDDVLCDRIWSVVEQYYDYLITNIISRVNTKYDNDAHRLTIKYDKNIGYKNIYDIYFTDYEYFLPFLREKFLDKLINDALKQKIDISRKYTKITSDIDKFVLLVLFKKMYF